MNDKLLHGNCFSKWIGAGKLKVYPGPRHVLDQALVWIACQLGAVERTNLTTEAGGWEDETRSSAMAGALAHATLKLSTNYPTSQ